MTRNQPTILDTPDGVRTFLQKFHIAWVMEGLSHDAFQRLIHFPALIAHMVRSVKWALTIQIRESFPFEEMGRRFILVTPDNGLATIFQYESLLASLGYSFPTEAQVVRNRNLYLAASSNKSRVIAITKSSEPFAYNVQVLGYDSDGKPNDRTINLYSADTCFTDLQLQGQLVGMKAL